MEPLAQTGKDASYEDYIKFCNQATEANEQFKGSSQKQENLSAVLATCCPLSEPVLPTSQQMLFHISLSGFILFQCAPPLGVICRYSMSADSSRRE